MTKKTYLTIILGLVVGLLIYYFFFYDRFYTVIDGEVYRSRQLSAKTLQSFITNKKIRSIINLRGMNEDKKWFREELEIAKKNRVAMYHVNLAAHRLPRSYPLNQLTTYLSEAKRPILIHCHAGVDRTGLASALALILKSDVPLSSAKKQFSLIYGIRLLNESAGPLFFSEYENWLTNNKMQHSRSNLLFWMDKEYIDGQGNIEFFIDSVSNHSSKESLMGGNRIFSFQKPSGKMTLAGWAFDPKDNSKIEDLFVVIKGQISDDLKRHNRPDVARVFHLDEKYTKRFMVGWSVQLDGNAIPSECHRIYLRINENKSTIPDIRTQFKVCLEE